MTTHGRDWFNPQLDLLCGFAEYLIFPDLISYQIKLPYRESPRTFDMGTIEFLYAAHI